MSFSEVLEQWPLILAEGSLIERLRRDPGTTLDPHLLHAAFVYSDQGQRQLESLYRQYLAIGRAADLPMLIFTPTWRANPERIAAAGLESRPVNVDGFLFVDEIREQYGVFARKIFIGGLMGCRGDAYRPADALSDDDARVFHAAQAKELATSGVDFLMGATLPAFSEALGMARAMARTGKPYVLSFVLRRTGALLDGTSLAAAVAEIDANVTPAPAFYMVNCVHPVHFAEAMRAQVSTFPAVGSRVLGLQANTSRLEPEELDGASSLDAMEPDEFGRAMVSVHRRFGTRILGGCCGTDERHIAAIVRHAPYETVH